MLQTQSSANILTISFALLTPVFASIHDLTIDGPDAIFLAGRTDVTIPNASLPWDSGTFLRRHSSPTPEEAKEQFPSSIPVTAGSIIRALDPAIGGVEFFNGYGPPFYGPSGNGSSGSNLSSLGGISGYNGPQGPLVGVFLNDTIPSSGPAPATIDFASTGMGVEFLSISPALRQIFYIGDGVTSAGVAQQFIAPPGATRLFLGIPDGFGFNGVPGAYDDNDGSYRIIIGVNEVPVRLPEIAVEQPAGTGLTAGTASVNVGTAPLGAGVSTTITIRNTGTAELTGVSASLRGSDSAYFSLTTPPAALVPAGGFTTLVVICHPLALGAVGANLRIASNDSDENPFDITLTATGIPPAPEIVIEQPAGTFITSGAATVDFGNVDIGASSSKGFVIRNAGSLSLSAIAASFTGGNVSEFTVETPPASTIVPGGFSPFTIRFTPGGEGFRSTTLRVASNDGDENPFQVTLTGRAGISLANAVDIPGTEWTTGGTTGWEGQSTVTHDGFDAAASGPVSHNQESWMETTFQGPGTLSFWWRVSSEDTYDWLEFYINGTRNDRISGTSGTWAQKSYALASGTNTLRWRYVKDSSTIAGSDRAWVDQVVFIGPQEIVVEAPNGEGLTSGTSSVNIGNIALGTSKTVSLTIRNTGNGPLANLAASLLPATPATVFINEVHYDNTGTDVNEFVEVAGTAGVNLTGWQLIPYNGANGSPYIPQSLSGVIPNQSNGYGALRFLIPNLENGSPDGLALYDSNRNLLVEFISYEGVFAGTSGVASGSTSTDMGVSEVSSTPVGQSLQKRGTGSSPNSFTWTAPSAESPGLINAGQQFTSNSPDFSVNATGLPSSLQSNGSATFLITLTPSGLGSRTNQVLIASNDSDENPFRITVTGTGVTPLQSFTLASTAAGLTGPNALASATPHNDGVQNLLKYAFNMSLSGPDVRRLVPGTGTQGLPSVTSITSGGTTTLRVEFLRRVGSGLVYTPKRSSNLSGASWVALSDTPTVTSINTDWERVLYEEPLTTATHPKCFAVVEVRLP